MNKERCLLRLLSMKTAIIIPARYASTRLPGKPLKKIAGREMLARVIDIAKSVKNADDVFVAVDDDRIFEAVKNFGATPVMTDPECPNGTTRCLAAVQALPQDQQPDLIMNLQGDAPLTPPDVIETLIQAMLDNPSWPIGTPAVELTFKDRADLIKSKEQTPHSGTCVVFDPEHKALYFSKSVIPAIRKIGADGDMSNTFRHVGLYAYRREALEKYVSLPESKLENLEKLEQLRALENGMPIHIVPVDYKGRQHIGVDSPEDIDIAEAIIKKFGELL